MDSLHTGSDELVYIQTEKVSVTIKGQAAHPSFQGAEYTDDDSTFKVFCNERFDCKLKGQDAAGTIMYSSTYRNLYSCNFSFCCARCKSDSDNGKYYF